MTRKLTKTEPLPSQSALINQLNNVLLKPKKASVKETN
jgi:hypothetical protein